MITPAGRGLVVDVGLVALTDQLTLNSEGRVRIPEAWGFKPGEELLPPGDAGGGIVLHTRPMDVYSFAITAYTVGTSHLCLVERTADN
jgi:hypothetical protein